MQFRGMLLLVPAAPSTKAQHHQAHPGAEHEALQTSESSLMPANSRRELATRGIRPTAEGFRAVIARYRGTSQITESEGSVGGRQARSPTRAGRAVTQRLGQPRPSNDDRFHRRPTAAITQGYCSFPDRFPCRLSAFIGGTDRVGCLRQMSPLCRAGGRACGRAHLPGGRFRREDRVPAAAQTITGLLSGSNRRPGTRSGALPRLSGMDSSRQVRADR